MLDIKNELFIVRRYILYCFSSLLDIIINVEHFVYELPLLQWKCVWFFHVLYIFIFFQNSIFLTFYTYDDGSIFINSSLILASSLIDIFLVS